MHKRFLLGGLTAGLVVIGMLLLVGFMAYQAGFSQGFGQGAAMGAWAGQGSTVPHPGYGPGYGGFPGAMGPRSGFFFPPLVGLCLFGLMFWILVGGLLRFGLMRRKFGRHPFGPHGPWGSWREPEPNPEQPKTETM